MMVTTFFKKHYGYYSACVLGYFLVMSADLTTPAAKTGFAHVLVASPLKKGGKWWYYVLVGCVLPSKREVAIP